MDGWEYRVLTWSKPARDSPIADPSALGVFEPDMQTRLNRQGLEGFDIVGVYTLPDGTGGSVVMKRPIEVVDGE